MTNIQHSFYFIENLTFLSWLFHVSPFSFKGLAQKRGWVRKFYYVDGTKAGVLIARFFMWIVGGELEQLKFRLTDVREENGDLILERVIDDDMEALKMDIKNNRVFCNIVENYGKGNRIKNFLFKKVLFQSLFCENSLYRPLFLIRVILWKVRCEGAQPEQIFLFLKERFWLSEIQKFADKGKIKIIWIKLRKFNLKDFISQSFKLKYFVRKILYYGMLLKYFFKKIVFHKEVSSNFIDVEEKKDYLSVDLEFQRLAVEYYGHLNLKSPELFSDLSFWQKSSLSADDIMIYFGQPKAPLDAKKWHDIKACGMTAVATHPLGAIIPGVPFYKHLYERPCINRNRDYLNINEDVLLKNWLHTQILNYEELYSFWFHFFVQNKTKVHVSWNQSELHCVIADALRDAGGVNVLYQRSYEDLPPPSSMMAVDVFFGFSNRKVQFERNSDSRIPYYVVTGYLGDHRFELLKKRAQDVRRLLKNHGAEKIVAYFDENSLADPRWCCLDHGRMAENFEYLLNKVLTNSKLGLILKPKVPFSLRDRLGPIAELLQRVEKTGRCYVFEDGVLQGSYPPSVASLGADIAIHGSLHSGTAGVESALAGTPTLLLDREGWPNNFLYSLGTEKVIFKNWDDLWMACQDHWKSQHGIPGFGDWSSIINDLDPFRDGRATERMGTYLEWLMEGFKAKLPREIVLADAAGRYCKIWGKDKVFSVNCIPKEYSAVG